MPPRRERAGAVLAAYAIGLPAAVLIRSAVASFYARSDTVTPLIASLTAVAVNVALKIVLTGPYGVVGLALATAIGIWVNLGLLVLLAMRRDWMAPGGTLGRTAPPSLLRACCSRPSPGSRRFPWRMDRPAPGLEQRDPARDPRRRRRPDLWRRAAGGPEGARGQAVATLTSRVDRSPRMRQQR